MSTFRPYPATCPACRHEWQVEVARGLHITRLPDIRERLLRGTFQVFTCPACNAPTVFEATVVYTDFDRNEYVAAETLASAHWQAAVARHETVFRDCFVNGPPIAQDMGKRFKRRLVYGFRALREKLVLWDAKLDDRVVEAVKGDVLRREELEPSEVVLRTSRVLDGGHLLFAMHEPVVRPDSAQPGQPFAQVLAPAFDFVTAPAAMYQARASSPSSISRDFPWLQDEWLVDLHDGPAYLYGG